MNTPLFIYPKQAAALLGVGTTKFYELNKLADFPKPRNPLGKRPMYIRKEIEDWAINLAASSDESE
jgi:predicted DNA-binding transcriptional regulator AlpA